MPDGKNTFGILLSSQHRSSKVIADKNGEYDVSSGGHVLVQSKVLVYGVIGSRGAVDITGRLNGSGLLLKSTDFGGEFSEVIEGPVKVTPIGMTSDDWIILAKRHGED